MQVFATVTNQRNVFIAGDGIDQLIHHWSFEPAYSARLAAEGGDLSISSFKSSGQTTTLDVITRVRVGIVIVSWYGVEKHHGIGNC